MIKEEVFSNSSPKALKAFAASCLALKTMISLLLVSTKYCRT